MRYILFLSFFWISATHDQHATPELVCVRTNKASKVCYYNFKLEGDKFHFTDVGCKYNKEKVLEKVKEGTIALAKNWKVECQK